jgi:VWFA-related protein
MRAVTLLAVAVFVAQTPPAFRSRVDLVEVTVVARDRDGRLVRDLTAADFQVLEEGAPQAVVAFERVSMPTAPRAAGDPATANIEPDVTSNERVADSRIFVLVLDALHVAPQRTRVVREWARRFIQDHMGSADLVAVVSPGAETAATEDFTSDKTRLIAAVDRFTSTKLRSASVEREEEAQAERRGGVALHAGKDPSDYERSGRAQSLASVLEALAGHLSRVERRRKSLVLFSEGIDYDVSDVMGRYQREASDVMRATNRAIASLMRANVALYAVDPRGLSSAEGAQVETPLHIATPEFNQSSIQSEYADSIRVLRHAAESTGGFAAVDGNDVRPAFSRILEESSEYYVLGYISPKPPKPGEFRSISVRVSRPDVRVVARKGHLGAASSSPRTLPVETTADPVASATPGRGRGSRIDVPPAEAPARPVAGVLPELSLLLASPLPRAGLPLRVQSVAFKGDDKKRTVQLVIEVVGRPLSFQQRGERFEEQIDLALITIDDRARAANGKFATIDLRLPPADLERVRATGVRWLSRLDLPPGRYQVRVAARALRSGLTGMVTHTIDVPPFRPDQLALSGITLTSLPAMLSVTRGDGWLQPARGTPPSAARSFVAGDRLTAAVEVYVPASARSGTDVAAHVAWADRSRSHASRRFLDPRPAGPWTAAAAFPVDTGPLPPGPYVLHISATRRGSAESVERVVPFEVVAAPKPR